MRFGGLRPKFAFALVGGRDGIGIGRDWAGSGGSGSSLRSSRNCEADWLGETDCADCETESGVADGVTRMGVLGSRLRLEEVEEEMGPDWLVITGGRSVGGMSIGGGRSGKCDGGKSVGGKSVGGG